jgi:hypothetical protein
MTLCSKESCNPMTMEVLAFLSLFSKSAKSLAGLTFTPNTMLGSSLSSNKVCIFNFHLPYKLSDDKCKPLWSHNLLTDWGLQLPCKNSAEPWGWHGWIWDRPTIPSKLFEPLWCTFPYPLCLQSEIEFSCLGAPTHQNFLWTSLSWSKWVWTVQNLSCCYGSLHGGAVALWMNSLWITTSVTGKRHCAKRTSKH